MSTEKDKFRTFADCYNLVVSDMERHGHSHIERLDSSKKYEFFPWSDHNTNDAGMQLFEISSFYTICKHFDPHEKIFYCYISYWNLKRIRSSVSGYDCVLG